MDKPINEILSIANNKKYIPVISKKKNEKFFTGGYAINAYLNNIDIEKTRVL